MTCIIGVVCRDGIVLVGDKKVKAGKRIYYENKIIPVKNYRNLVVAAAGYLDVRDKFVQDIENLPFLLKKKILKEDPSRGFVGLTEDIAFRLREIYKPRYGRFYDYEGFEALVCHKPKSAPPFFYYIDAKGNSSKISREQAYKILGTGEQYGHLFIRPAFPKYGDLDGVAAIATFIICLIDEYGIDDTIGPDKRGKVQVWKFPNKAEPYEVSGSELRNVIEEAKDRLNKFANFLILGRTRA